MSCPSAASGSAHSAWPLAIRPCACARIAALSTPAVDAGSFQLTDRLLARRIASQVLLATTATALTEPAVTAPRVSEALHGTTAIAPEGLDGVLASVPPMTGQCLIAANTMPGKKVSIPYLALPSTLDGMSTRGTGWPISRKLPGSVRRRSAGTVCDAASVASALYGQVVTKCELGFVYTTVALFAA